MIYLFYVYIKYLKENIDLFCLRADLDPSLV